MNPRRLLAGPVAVMLLASGASAIELNSSEALKYYGQGTQDFRVSPTGNALIDDGTLNITNNGEAVANFSGTGINLYKPLSVRSSGPLSVANGIELTGTSSNTIESLSTFYLSTSSGSASDIVLDPTGQVGVDSNLETTGNISVGGNQLDLENGDIENAGDIQTGSVSDSDADNEIDFNSNRLTGLKDPNNEQDAATQSYVNSNDDTIQDNQGLEEVLSLDNKVGGENINFNETSNIQASGTNAITLDNNQNVGIPNGNIDINSNDLEGTRNLELVDGNDNLEYRIVYRGSDSEFEISDESNDVFRIEDSSDDVEIPNGDLNLGGNNIDDIASVDGGGDAIQVNDQIQLNSNRLKTDTNGNYIEGNTVSFSRLESGSGGEIDVRSAIDFNNVNMKNIQFEDAGDLNSDGDITNGNVENAELDNSQVTVAGNTVSLGSSTAVSVNDLSDISSTSEAAGQTLLYDTNNNQYTNARITAGQGLGRTTSNGGLTVGLNPGNGIETNNDNTRVNPQQIAGDGLKETSATSLGVEPNNFAGSFLSEDGSDNLQVNTGTFISGDGNGNIDVDISDGLQNDGSGNIQVNWNDADDLNSQGKISDFSEATDLGTGGDISDGSVQDAELDLADGLTVAGGSAGDGSQSGLRVDGNGNLYFSGSLNFPGDTNIISAQELNGSFVPSQGAQFNVGSSSKRWKNGYFSGTVNTDFVQKAGGDADIEFAGSGRIDIRNSNNNDVIRARDSGEIDIPRGNIDVSGGTVDARGGGDLLNDGFRLEENGVLKSRRSDGNLYFDIESSGGTTRLRDSGDGDIIRANDNGNVEIPNGGVDIGAPTDTGKSLDVGGGARFAGDIDVNDKEISNLDLQNVNNIEMDGNIQGGGVDMSLQEVGSILGPNNGDSDLNIQTQGGGGHVVSIEDGSSSNSDIATFKEGSQNVEIPNGNLNIEGKITEIGGKGTNEIRDDGDLVVDSDDKIEFADNGNTYMEVGASASEGNTQIDTDGDVTTNGRLDANTEGGEISDDSGSSMDVQTDGDVVVTLG